ncbi:tyrosine-type recombinase/integrase [Micromonospora sp. NPDC005257]|uniref:tyrosine-type recombinase/integrase n=1 Tax=unclassified Micromonospora TaxID=2617518 RepID=UPI0033FB6FE8
MHDLRHTVVSLLMELGVPPHVVQAIARHADVKITLKVYSHANLDAMRQALGRTAVIDPVAVTAPKNDLLGAVSLLVEVGAAGFEPATPRL